MSDRASSSSSSFSLVLEPRRAGLRVGQAQILDVLVRLQATARPARAGSRAPKALALVIDRSGSMAGRPIEEARRCAEFVASRLRPTDIVSLVQFDSRVDCLWPAVPLGNGQSLRAAIGRIEAGGSTDLHGGWVAGARSLADLPDDRLRRVVLLSDGCANSGLTDMGAITRQCAEWSARGISTSTCGLGSHFNEDLMVAMAKAGAGNHYYGDTAEDLIEPFGQELDLLADLALRRVSLRVSAPPGVGVEVLGDLRREAGACCLPDLAWQSEAWAMVRLTVPEALSIRVGDRVPLLSVSVDGQSLDGERIRLGPTDLALPVMTPSGWVELAESALVQRRWIELEAARMLEAMRDAASVQDWAEVDRLLAEAQRAFSGNEWVHDMLTAMEAVAGSRSRERLMKEAKYASARLNSRLTSLDEAMAQMPSADEPSYLRRKRLQGKTEAPVRPPRA
jgi:Ca-activated chloride channel family protein